MNKKIFALAILFIFSIVMFFGVAVHAVDVSGGLTKSIGQKAGYDAAVTQTSLATTVGGVIRGVLSVVGVIFLVLTIYAGVLWMTAAGNEETVTKAQKIVKSSVIGLVIIGAAYGITALILAFAIGASAPSSSSQGGGYTPDRQMGCCVNKGSGKCEQLATKGECDAKASNEWVWWQDASCYNISDCDDVSGAF
jgi:hypothetical protein